MKSPITFYIGLFVTLLTSIQMIIHPEAIRIIGISIGLFFIIWAVKIGWTRKRNITVLVGHLAVVAGCLVCAYALYSLPFLKHQPSMLEVADSPLFWGIFTIWGGNCMITHGYCSCTIKMHEMNNKLNETLNGK
jgi:hypothetical protein